MVTCEHSSTSAHAAPEHVILPRHVVFAAQFALAQTAARLERVASAPPDRTNEMILGNARDALAALHAAVALARMTAPQSQPERPDPHVVRPMGHGGLTGVNDYLMSDGSVHAMTPAEAVALVPSVLAQAESMLMEAHVTFEALRAANRARMPQLRNTHGVLIHTKVDGSDVAPAQWLQALVGEIGEYANLRKKFERGDMPEGQFKAEAAKELGDVMAYLDTLALELNIDLGQATMDKFNEVSERMGSTVRLLGAGWVHEGNAAASRTRHAGTPA